MWAKLAQAILMPLIEKSVVALWKSFSKWFSNWQYRRAEKKRIAKLKKENDIKVNNYENSDSDNTSDDFGSMP